MYFHNVATHQCIPDRPSIMNVPWQPFHMQSGIHFQEAVPLVDARPYLQYLRLSSDPLPRRQIARPTGPVHFNVPQSGAIEYVSSWPPAISMPQEVTSPDNSPSVYYTPMSTPTLCESPTTTSSTLSSPQTSHSLSLTSSPVEVKIAAEVDSTDDEENRPPVETKLLDNVAPLRRLRPMYAASLKGLARLRRNAPPALSLAEEEEGANDSATRYILELGDVDGLVKPCARLDSLLLRRGDTEEQRSRLLALLVDGN
ncbi:hypothetical protein FB45DRAFT_891545 [Roridomyces roridus]|uniref:Uncharacterized protein n=1 Tax=Roridomyces roridus TaxID=1738132 RepID=A0AAD7CE81_9AGAR|nr:hypothetical protein FB45DRAFT_891545 [Roridomyces roridus]